MRDVLRWWFKHWGQSEICVVCLYEFKYNDDASKLGCGHACEHDFHFGCIKEWLMVTNMCPLCKKKVILFVS